MSFKINDHVENLFTHEKGVITGFLDGETAYVAVDGTEIPIFLEFLKKIEAPVTPQVPQKSRIKVVKKQSPAQAAKKINTLGINLKADDLPDYGIRLLLQPFYHADGDLHYFLVFLQNDSGQPLNFDYRFRIQDREHFSLKKDLAARDHIMLHSFDFEAFNEKPHLSFEFQSLGQLKGANARTFSKTYRPKPKMVLQSKKYLRIVEADGYIISLYNKLPKSVQQVPIIQPKEAVDPKQMKINMLLNKFEENEPTHTPAKDKVKIHAKDRIIDLHIEQLITDWKHLPKNNLLTIQIQHFQKEIEQAIKNKEPNMVVIHGIGKGKLKNQIIKHLRFYPEVTNFKNEFDPRYGFGATKIYFEYEED